MKKWVSMLLTVMMLLNSVFSPIIALAEEADTFPTGYAYAAQDVRIYDNIDTDGDGKTELAQIGTILAGGYLYVTYVESNGAWADVAFPVGGEVVLAHARTKELTHVAADGGAEPSGLSYNGHALSTVVYQEKHYEAPKATEMPAEEPTAVPTEEPASQEPEVTEPVVDETTEAPAVTETEEPKAEETDEVEATEAPEVEETEEPEVEEPGEDEATEAPEVEETEEPEVEEPSEDEATEAPEVEETEEPEVEEPSEDEVTEEPEVEETEEPEVEEPAEDEIVEGETTEEPEVEETEEPEVEETEEPEVEEPAEEATEEPTEVQDEEVEEEPITFLQATYHDVVVTVTGEPGSIPAGAELQVEHYTEVGSLLERVAAAMPEDMVVVSVDAYDITLLVDGEVVQPSENVQVSFSNLTSAIALFNNYSVVDEGDELETFVFHVNDSQAELLTTLQGEASTFVLSLPHFSVYAKVVGKLKADTGDHIDGQYETKNSKKVKGQVWDEESQSYVEVEIDLTSPAFDFHIFTKNATVDADVNGNIAADYFTSNGSHDIGTRQLEGQGVLEDNYFGMSASNLGRSKVKGRIVTGSGVVVSTDDNNDATVGGGEGQSNSNVYQEVVPKDAHIHYYKDGCYTRVGNEYELTCTKTYEGEHYFPWIDIELELAYLSIMSGQLGQLQATGEPSKQKDQNDPVEIDGNQATNGVLIIKIKASDYRNKTLFNIKNASGKTVIINVVVDDPSCLANWNSRIVGNLDNAEDNAYYDCTVLWNFIDENGNPYSTNGNRVDIGTSDWFAGSILAPDMDVRYGALNGSVAARSTMSNGQESHNAFFTGGSDEASIKVSKTLYDVTLGDGATQTFYFALFLDPAGTQRATDVPVRAVTVGNHGTVTATFTTGLKEGVTYYVFETDKNGKPVSNNGYEITGNGTAVEIGGSASFTNLREGTTPGPTPVPTPEPGQPDGDKAEFQPRANKKLQGANDAQTNFYFVLEPKNDAAKSVTGTIEAGVWNKGDAWFNKLTFREPGEYVFTIKEKDVSDSNWQKDTHEWELTVVVGDDYSCSASYKCLTCGATNSSYAEFTNVYDGQPAGPETSFQPKANKQAVVPQYDNVYNKGVDQFSFKLTATKDGAFWYEETQVVYTWQLGNNNNFFPFTFDEKKITEAGTYVFTITEEKPQGADSRWTFDEESIVITVVVSEDESGEGFKKEVTYTKGGASIDADSATFVNTYGDNPETSPTPDTDKSKGHLTINLQKNVEGNPATDETFWFTITQTSPTDRGLFENGAFTKTVSVTGSGTASFGTIAYDNVWNVNTSSNSLYVFEIREAKGDASGYTYDDGYWKVTVEAWGGETQVNITWRYYDANGNEVSNRGNWSGTPDTTLTVDFNNVYTQPVEKETDVDFDITKRVTKATGSYPPDEDVSFTFVLKDSQGNEISSTLSDWTFGDNTVPFKLEGLKAGTYTYTLTETKGTADHWTYSEASYQVTVVVSDPGGDAALTYEVTFDPALDQNAAHFENIYSDIPDASYPEFSIDVTKILEGATFADLLEDYTFLVSVQPNNGGFELPKGRSSVPMQRSNVKDQSASEATVSYGSIKFTKPGTYTITVSEQAGNKKGWTYDKTVYEIVVVVEAVPEGSEHLEIKSATMSGEEITDGSMTATFTNKFTAPAPKSGSITVVKDVKFADHSKQVASKEFTFLLLDENGEQVGEATITWSENGENSETINLPSYEYKDIGKHTYKLVEVKKTEDGWTYDETEYTVTVDVGYDANNHELTVNVKVNGQDINSATFTNRYNEQPEAVQPEIVVTKNVVVENGSEWPENTTFTFTLSSEDEGALDDVERTKTITWAENGQRNSATFKLPKFTTDDIGRTFTYTITESDVDEYGWQSDKVKTVTVTIGQDPVTKELTVTYGESGNAVTFTNRYNKVAQTVEPEIDVTKEVVVVDGSEKPKSTTFTFTLSSEDEDALNEQIDTTKSITWVAGAENKATFTLPKFTEADDGRTFTYTITESDVDEYGWQSDKVKTVKVTIRYDEANNVLTADVEYVDSDDENAAAFKNIYNKVAQKVQPEIDVTKEVVIADGSEQPDNTTFTFTLSSNDQGALNDQIDTTKSITWVAGGENKAIFTLPVFTEADDGKTFTYTITESHSNEYGWSYDTVKTVTVTVNYDAKTNTLSVTYGGEGKSVRFTNNYKTPGPAQPELDVKKSVTGANAPAETFKFEITGVGEDNSYSDEFTIEVGEGATGASKKIKLPEYKKADIGKTFVYEIREVAGDELGWSYSDVVYTVTVKVGYSKETNSVVADVTISGDAIVFTNGYNEPGEGSAEVDVTKAVTGENMPEGTFSFVIIGEDGLYKKDFEITVGADGEPVDKKIQLRTYHKEHVGNTYEYVISEVKGNVPGWTYSGESFRVQIKVAYDETDNKITTTVIYPDGKPEFTNEYTEPKPDQPEVDVTKSVSGANAPAETFKFTIKGVGEDNNYYNEFTIEVGKGATGASKKIQLPKYTKADIDKTYVYEIAEVAGNAYGWTYSQVVKTVTVKVTYNETTNEIKTEVTTDGGAIEFSNEYEEPAPVQPELDVTKSVNGAKAPAETFEFTIKGVGNSYSNTFKIEVGEGKTSADTTIVLPKYTKDDINKTFVYEIAEVAGNAAGWTYSQVVKTVTVDVTYDKTNNKVVANVKIDDVAGTSMTFSNNYEEPKAATPKFDVTKNVTGDNTPEKTFKFTITGEDDGYTDTFEITVGANGKTVSKTIPLPSYTKADIDKTFVYTVSEVDEGTAGWTFDKTPWTVTVDVSYDDEKNEIVANVTVTGGPIVFTNNYETKPTKHVVDVTKTVTGADAPDTTFQFTLSPSAGDGFTVANATAEVTYPGTVTTASFGEITFTKAGVYQFTVQEVRPDDARPGWTYDNAVWTVTVTVEDLNSQLTVTGVTYQKNDEAASENGSVAFGNSYKVEETSIAIKVNKTVTGNNEPEGNKTFTFKLTKVSADPADGYTIDVDTVTASKTDAGYVADKDFGIKFTRPGTYEFVIEETDVAAPYHKDTKTYTVHVEVVDDGTGTLNARYTIDGEETDEVAFVNQYSETEFKPEVDKTMTADDLTKVERTFSFTLTQTSPEATYRDRASTTVDAETGKGTAEFGTLTFYEKGVYTYTITEDKPAVIGDGYVYDDAVWTLTVTVEQAEDGTLTATGVYSKGDVEGAAEFTNSYKAAPVSYAPKAEKVVKSEISDEFSTNETFSFTLEANDEYDGVTMSEPLTMTRSGAGEVTFGNITFTKVGKYEFTIKETAGETDGWTYDDAIWTVVVEVTDNNGHLTTSVTYEKDGVEVKGQDYAKFENTYTVTAEDIKIGVKKSVTGNTAYAPDTTFSFTLKAAEGQAEGGYEITTDKVTVTKEGNVLTPDGTFGIKFTKPGEYDFVITEGEVAEHYTKANDVQVHVVVVDNKNGTLDVTYTVNGVTNVDAEFVNQYSETEFTPEVGKTLDTADLTNANKSYSFTLTQIAPEDANDYAETTMKVDAVTGEGKAAFKTLKFYEEGEYKYTIAESVPDSVPDGYEYDTAEWTLTVKVERANDGTLSATATYEKNGTDVANNSQAEFTNKYSATGEFQLTLTKVVDGNEVDAAATFTFRMSAVAGNALARAALPNPVDVSIGQGGVSFDPIEITAAGTYEFRIEEIAGEVTGYVYDGQYWIVTVVAEDLNGTGEYTLTVTRTHYTADGDVIAEEDEVVFTNHYHKVKQPVEVEKKLSGPVPSDRTASFSFTIEQAADNEEGAVLPEQTELTVTTTGADSRSAKFGDITFYKAGTYSFIITEVVEGMPAGFKAATEPQTVTITVSEDPETHALYIDSVEGQEYKATFTNIYKPSETDIELKVTKNVEGAREGAKKEFSFTLSEVSAEPADGYEPISGKTVTIKYPADVLSATFDAIHFTKAGTYVFTISETASGEEDGWTYDSNDWTVTVKVTDDNGELKASAEYAKTGAKNSEAAIFDNSYEATGDITFEVEKKVNGRPIKVDSFVFTLTSSNPQVEESIAVKAGASGKFQAVAFKEPGEYTFTISETEDETLKGYTFAKEQTITVIVSDDYNGHLVASVNGVDVGETFVVTMTNDYQPAKTAIQLPVTKNIGGAFAPNRNVQFSFVLKEGDTVIETLPLTVLADKTSVSGLFAKIEYTEEGTHYYTISEVLPDELEAGFPIYDDTVYNVKVEVSDIGGELKADVTIEGGSATFNNVYAPASATLDPAVTKTIEGKPETDADFRFELTLTSPVNSPAVIMPTNTILTITGETTARFDEITFTEPGDYEFQIVELDDGVTGYGYATTVWTAKVHVDDVEGKLDVTSVAYTSNEGQTSNDGATFTNDYAPLKTSLELDVVKNAVNGQTSKDKSFGFELTLTDADPIDGVAFTGPATKWITYPASKSTSFDCIEFTKVGTYVFSIRELEASGGAGWSYDTDAWTVTVKVVDQGGTLSASAEYVKVGTTEIKSAAEFTNVYQPKGDITFQIQKNVEGTSNIDTFEFTLTSDDPVVNETITIKAGETVNFSTVNFTKAGEYVFTISETKDPALKGYTFAEDATIVVVVEDDGMGNLWVREQSNPEGTHEAVIKREFTNIYAPLSTAFAPSVTKVVEGEPAQDAEFTFHIDLIAPEATDAVVMPEDKTVTITGEGTKSFKSIGFEAAGTYVFEIAETKGNAEGYSYDESVWTVTVTVEDVGGELAVTSVVYVNSVSAELTNDSTATFTNTYTEPTPEPSEEPTAEPTPVVTEAPTEAPTPEVTATPVPVIPMTNLSGTKTWVDDDNAAGLRPATIEVTLYANGVAQPNVPVWTNTDTNVWTYTFTQLPVTTLNGTPIIYTVVETPVDYYTGTQDGVNFTNTIVPKQEVAQIEVSGQKTWQDNNNAGNTRPASITIELQQNGVTIRTAVVTAADNWQYTFTDLPEGDGYGNSYVYAVREQAVPGYYAVYAGMNVTNVLIPNLVTFNDQPVARGLPVFQMFNEGELADMFELFDYGVPLFGVLLGTGLEVPMYPFVFAGCGALAIVLLIVFGRKKKED